MSTDSQILKQCLGQPSMVWKQGYPGTLNSHA